MARRAPRSRVFDAALHAVLVGCVLLLAACAPRVGGSGDGIGTGAGTIGVTDRDVAVAPRIGVIPAAGTGAAVDAVERVSPRLSPACSAPAVPPVPDHLVVHGLERLVLSHAPERPDGTPRDLVIAFHGRTNDAARARRYFGLDAALPEAVIVYPQALPAGPGTFAWADPGDPPDALRDFELVDAIVDAFGRTLCIDLERVFVVGHSLGAYFANDVACSLGDRVRAVASVAGGLQGARCVPGTAALLLHHPDDALVPMSAGEGARDAFRLANGVSDAPPTPSAQPALATLRCVRHGGDAPNPVVWCAHDDDTWPGGRYDPHVWPDATAIAIAAFFRGLP